ncbi:MAG: ABC transporter permease [Lachnospiraceae bacterium]|nr:ABC transporter permease [Lachnospiraceae bacterium]
MEKKNIKLKEVINRRTLVTIFVALALVYLVGIFLWGIFMDPSAYAVHYENKFISPCAEHPFGTDFMGRDMFARSIKGLSNSLIVGVLAAVVSSIVALILGIASAVFGGWVDRFVNWCVDLCMGLPHIVLLILISFMVGKGTKGVTIAVALTHWPALTRIVRAEVMQVRSSQYVQAAYKMGRSRLQVAVTHIIPHVLPAYLIGLILLFPHAIMHEASITFLGFGLPAEMPAIGVILSEAMKHITTGKWWLAVYPGLMLLVAVILFDVIGENLKKLWNPDSGNE